MGDKQLITQWVCATPNLEPKLRTMYRFFRIILNFQVLLLDYGNTGPDKWSWYVPVKTRKTTDLWYPTPGGAPENLRRWYFGGSSISSISFSL
jgi:hypothetical protein